MGIQIPENWGELLEPGLRMIFDLERERRESLEKRQVIFNVTGSAKAEENDLDEGALSDRGFNAFEQTRRVGYHNFNKGYKWNYEHREFADGFLIERKLMDDNLYPGASLPKSIADKPKKLAKAASIHAEKSAAEVLNHAFTDSGTTGSGFNMAGADGVGLCSTAHPYSPSDSTTQSNEGTAALSEANVDAARQLMRAFTDDQGNIIAVNPGTLVVPPELETLALKIQQSQLVPGTANNDKNIVGGRIRDVISWDYLTDANAWFLMDEDLAGDLLNWFDRVPLEFAGEGQFDTIQNKYRAYRRFSRGWSGWQFVYGNNPG